MLHVFVILYLWNDQNPNRRSYCFTNQVPTYVLFSSRAKFVIFLLKMKNCLISTSAIDEHPNLVSILYFYDGKTPNNELKLGRKCVRIDGSLSKKDWKNQHSFEIISCKKRPQILFKHFNFFPLMSALDHCGITET